MGLLVTAVKSVLGPRAAPVNGPEDPRFNLNDPKAWDLFLGGTTSSSGIRVNRQVALTYSPWWRGINLLSGSVAKLPLLVYRYQGRGKVADPRHPAYRLLRRKANPHMTAFVWKQLMVANALQSGNAYSAIMRRGDGSPAELLHLDPELTFPAKEGDSLLYVTQIDGEYRKILGENVLHLKGIGLDGLVGISVYQVASESIGLGLAARRYGSVFFKNNARPNVAVEVPGRLTEPQLKATQQMWADMHTGIDNQHRLAILQGGAKLATFTINARDAQLLETRQFETREIANWLGIPAHKLNDAIPQSYNSKEQANEEYLEDGLDPWLSKLEEECWDKLLTEEQKDKETHEVNFDVRRMLRANQATRGAYNRTALGGVPWMTVNEVRETEGLDPIEDGDEIPKPLNIAGNGGGGFGDGPPDPEKDPADQEQDPPKDKRPAAVAAAYRRIIRRVRHQAARAAKHPRGWIDFVDGLAERNRAAAVGDLTGAVGTGTSFPADAAEAILGEIREALLAASECKPADLPARADAALAQLEERYHAD